MDRDNLDRERERALRHPLRRTILDALGEQEQTLPQLAAALPDAAATVLPATPPEAVLSYHLRVLREARLVTCAGGLYRRIG